MRGARRATSGARGGARRGRRRGSLLVHAFGLAGLLLVYLPILTPNNVGFDSRWYHLGIAEHYAATGAVQRFPEGWWVGAGPHLASFLYTWAFLLPFGRITDRIELAAHLELSVFLFSLLGIPALVRRLVPPRSGGSPYRHAWVARFLFPGVFLYDSSLCLGADHVARVLRRPHLPPPPPRHGAWLRGSVSSSPWRSPARCSPSTRAAIVLVVPALLAVALRAVVLLVRALRRRAGAPPVRAAFAGPLAALGAGLAFTAPHWLKNAVWYGDPLYPALHALARPRPWTADSAVRFDIGFASAYWAAPRSLAGLGRTLGALFTFSFVPNDWDRFHGATPVFGSLFTLSLAALPFLKHTKRIWGLVAATHLGIFAWYWINHQDRYLQAALPWMAAATAAVLGLCFGRGSRHGWRRARWWRSRSSGGPTSYFIPAHVYAGVPAKAVLELLLAHRGQARQGPAHLRGLLRRRGQGAPGGRPRCSCTSSTPTWASAFPR